MARTRESYQQARAALLALEVPKRPARTAPEARDVGVDLLPIRYFGVDAALATFEIAGRLAVLTISSPYARGPFPLNPLIALGPARAVH
jgi:hypothetical protein